MKLLSLFLLIAASGFAQEDRPVRYFPTDPVSPCSVITPLVNNWVTGKLWECVGNGGVNNGTWKLVSQAINTTSPLFLTSVYNFTAQTPNVTLGIGAQTVTMKPCPPGVAGSDTGHYLYLSGGTGTAEAVLITGGTCTSGATTGTVTFVTTSVHTGAWTITSATAGLQEALNFGGANAWIYVNTSTGILYQPAVISNSHVLVSCGGCKLSSQPPNGGAALIVSASNITLDGLWIDNPDTNVLHSYDSVQIAANSATIAVKNCVFTGNRVNGIEANALGIQGVLVDGNLFSGVNIGVLANTAATDINDVRVVNNRFVGIYGDGVNLNVYTGGGFTTARNISIVGNHCEIPNGSPSDTTSGFCIQVAGIAKGTISGNTLHNCRIQCIHVESGASQSQGPLDWTISGNQIDTTGTGAAGLNDGIWIINCTYCVIANNVISGAHDRGIEVIYSGTEEAVSLAVTGNTTRGNTGDGMRFQGSLVGGIDQRWNIAHNVSVGNTGNGLLIGGLPNDTSITDNILQGNTGFGVSINGSVSTLTWRDNDVYNNTAGDMTFPASNGSILTQGAKKAFILTFSGTSVFANGGSINLGKGAIGDVTVHVFDQNAPTTNYDTGVFHITFDGTTLVQTLISTDLSGSLSAIALQVSGSTLQVRVNNSGASSTFLFDVQFSGSIVRR